MNKFVLQVAKTTKRHAPEILTGLGVIGVIGTAVLTGQATIKALELIDEAEAPFTYHPDLSGEEFETSVELSKGEIVALVWPCYIPAIMVGASTIACIIGAGTINHNRQKSLVGAYTMLNTAFSEYRAKNIELYGTGTDVKIRDAVTEDHLMRSGKLHKPSDGKILVCEEMSNWFFDTTMAEVIDAQLQLNKKFAENGEVALNEFYEFLGIPTCDFGEELGWECWAVSQMNGSAWLDFTNRLVRLDDGSEYYVIECKQKPYAFNYPHEDDDLPFFIDPHA